MQDVRQTFLDYFAKNNHQVLPSSSLVPSDDPTLLFTNAGMNQFKEVFLGKAHASFSTAATSQKCVRAGGKHNDLENVGHTKRHHTFFEMLGNFSFGDYFKQQAIELAWTFVEKELQLDTQRVYVSVFHQDQEAYDLWHKHIGLEPKRIFSFGEKDNFWSMGDTGPCGPCSEIFYDMAPDGSQPTAQSVEAQGDRFLEFWNLVFMQYMQNADGSRQPLPSPSIDTGMGLERITAILEGVDTNYDTQLFRPLLQYVSDASKMNYFEASASQAEKASARVLADHIRATTFLIGDGVLPSKEGRGYVLRRIMRRAMRHGRNIGLKEKGFSDMAHVVVESYGHHYDQLKVQENRIVDVIAEEEARFSQTIDRGMVLLDKEIEHLKKQNKKVLPGDQAFHLYDTYGFPVDLTADVLKEHGYQVDQAGFDEAFEAHREKARGSWKGNQNKVLETLVQQWASNQWQTIFMGYDQLQAEGEILALVHQDAAVDTVNEGDEVEVLLNQTPFYGESGGQVGDVGSMKTPKGALDVLDTKRIGSDFIVHRCVVTEGSIAVGEQAQSSVNEKLRMDAARNHTATHILHATLREVLGEHVEQRGSLVAPERLRFDFTHPQGLTATQWTQLERMINQRIWQNATLDTQIMSLEEAKASGAIALFGEKYGETVRVVKTGAYSVEFCGGTHLARTGEIGLFKIIAEKSISAGIRRIEAFTGDRALYFVQQLHQQSQALSEKLGTSQENLLERVDEMQAQQKKLKKQRKAQPAAADQKQVHRMGDITVWTAVVDLENAKDLRGVANDWMNQLKSGVVVLGHAGADKASVMIKISSDQTSALSAKALIEPVKKELDGSGGGKDDFAQAGGPKVDALEAAIQAVLKAIDA